MPWLHLQTLAKSLRRLLIRLVCAFMPTCIIQEKSPESDHQKPTLLFTPQHSFQTIPPNLPHSFAYVLPQSLPFCPAIR